ncbi:MAG: hypothetical protein ACP5T2_06830 [Thermoprotei archaeon]
MSISGFWQTAQVTSAANYLSSVPNSSGFGINFNKSLEVNYETMQLGPDPLRKGYGSSSSYLSAQAPPSTMTTTLGDCLR